MPTPNMREWHHMVFGSKSTKSEVPILVLKGLKYTEVALARYI
ncbi:hypothetical protein [uncultured Porphyromonas sp.]|nr:hypothetical protein [uncultured Porphyromonas sp.]